MATRTNNDIIFHSIIPISLLFYRQKCQKSKLKIIMLKNKIQM